MLGPPDSELNKHHFDPELPKPSAHAENQTQLCPECRESCNIRHEERKHSSRKSVKSHKMTPLDGSARCSARTAAAKLKILRVCHRLAVEDAGELGPGVSALGGAGSQSFKRCARRRIRSLGPMRGCRRNLGLGPTPNHHGFKF